MRDDPTVVALVARARDGDKLAWDDIVDRYKGMMWRICLRHGLGDADSHDVGQTVWLLLYRSLDTLQNAAALPGWLETTTKRECYRIHRRRNREIVETATVVDMLPPDDRPVDDDLLLEERRLALRCAFAELPAECQEALTLLMQVPPLTYAEVGERLGMRIGSLGPRRGRCLDKLRQHPLVSALIDSASDVERGEKHVRPMVGN